MQQLICTAPGLLEYTTVPQPVLQKGHAIIRINRIGICGTDLHAFEGIQPYFTYPRVLGHELSAELVDADGDLSISPGSPVTIIPYFHCGSCVSCKNGKTNCCVYMQVCGVHINGGMTEYLSVPIHHLVDGTGLSQEALALVEPFAIGAHGVRRAAVQTNEFVLVIGAGPIGLATMQCAKLHGAKLIAMDTNPHRLDFCREQLGIEHCIDPGKTDSIRTLQAITNGDMPTVVIDATGNRAAINNAFPFLAHGGKYVLIGLQAGDIVFNHPEFHKREATLMSSRNATKEDFDFVLKAFREKKISPAAYITYKVPFSRAAGEFRNWLKAENRVIKAMIEIPGNNP